MVHNTSILLEAILCLSRHATTLRFHYLERLNKVVTSSAITFDDIPAEMPFLTGRPDHWVSPAPGIDDAALEEQGRMEEVGSNDIGGIGPSCLMAGTSPEDPAMHQE